MSVYTAPVRRGSAYWVRFDGDVGSEQHGIRPALVIQNDKGNRYSPTTIVVPLTTQKKSAQPTHHEFVHVEKGPQTACAEQVRTIDKSRIVKYAFDVSEDDMRRIDRCVNVAVSRLETERTPRIRRGDVYRCDLSGSTGSEEFGECLAVVVQNDRGNYFSSTTIVLPLLRPRGRSLPMHVSVELGGRRYEVAAEQIRTVAKARLRRYVCQLPENVMAEIEKALNVAVTA